MNGIDFRNGKMFLTSCVVDRKFYFITEIQCMSSSGDGIISKADSLISLFIFRQKILVTEYKNGNLN